MVDMYVALVIAGRRTCNKENKKVKQVPANYRELVLDRLRSVSAWTLTENLSSNALWLRRWKRVRNLFTYPIL